MQFYTDENLNALLSFLYLALISRTVSVYERVLTEIVSTDRTQ